jgi:hypothetical protein
MHRLLQLAMREWLEANGEIENNPDAAVKLVLAALPKPELQF